MRKLTSKEIEKFASRSGVKKIDVEMFLSTLPKAPISICMKICDINAKNRGWNLQTQKAIRDGIRAAFASKTSIRSAMKRAKKLFGEW